MNRPIHDFLGKSPPPEQAFASCLESNHGSVVCFFGESEKEKNLALADLDRLVVG
jgi:hypothetical protein